jgi:hypothetical protein
MADSKVTALTGLTSFASSDNVMVIDDVNGTPVSKKATLKDFFGGIPANTTIAGILTASANLVVSGANASITSNLNATGVLNTMASLHVTANRITINTSKTADSNNATTELGTPLSDRPHDGAIFWSNTFLYIAISNTVIKRVSLSAFS